MLDPKAQIELFHLTFLRLFSLQIDQSLYAIKGGCNLRFFFDSIRYSEDLDLDIHTIQQQTLENKVNKILKSETLPRLLKNHEITRVNATAHKQTQTTQRWKIQLHTENAQIPYHTKIEFSRRNSNLNAIFSNVNAKICQTYCLAPIRLSHYDLVEATTQKLLALAHRSLTQARDIFDLYLLLHYKPLYKTYP